MEETSKRNQELLSPFHYVKRGCLSIAASFEQGFGYFKASVVGLAKKLTAKTEKDATAAEMQTAKMQVEAADRAEDIKKRLD